MDRLDTKIQRFKAAKQNHKGFTLIELLIVIAIIGILSTVLMVNFIGIRERARDARRKSDLRQIQQALELYKADIGSYPDTSVLDGRCNVVFNSGNTVYMSKIPQDPDGVDCYHYSTNAAITGGTPYVLYTCLENTNDSDPHNVSGNSTYGCGVNKAFVLSSDQ